MDNNRREKREEKILFRQKKKNEKMYLKDDRKKEKMMMLKADKVRKPKLKANLKNFIEEELSTIQHLTLDAKSPLKSEQLHTTESKLHVH